MLKNGDLVIYESTVYPGATEGSVCPNWSAPPACASTRTSPSVTVPNASIPATSSGATTIPKVTSGSTPETAEFVDALYRRIVVAGTHQAPASRWPRRPGDRNTQRDVNIALMNEFALIFHRLGIDTQDVLAAAGTKWNFLPFKPGLVGGHCIGVDPYYLIQKAQSTGYYLDLLIASRRINDAHGAAWPVGGEADGATWLCGRWGARADPRLHLQENCPDLRNTRVVDLVGEFRGFGVRVDVHDPGPMWTRRGRSTASSAGASATAQSLTTPSSWPWGTISSAVWAGGACGPMGGVPAAWCTT